VNLDVLEKITHEADTVGRTPLLALRFENAPEGVEHDWLTIPARVLFALLDGRKKSQAS
jgi:hypothetical protein